MHQHQPQPIHPSAYPGHILHMGSPAPEGYDFDVLADTSTTTDQVETANHHYFEVEHELDVWRRGVLQVPVQSILELFTPPPPTPTTITYTQHPRPTHYIAPDAWESTMSHNQSQHHQQHYSSPEHSNAYNNSTYGTQPPYHHNGNYSSSISSNDPLERMTQEEADLKRLRNTAASARFRAKKKKREQSLERASREKKERLQALEGRIRDLEAENQWLKDLIMEKNEVRSGKGEGDRKDGVGTL